MAPPGVQASQRRVQAWGWQPARPQGWGMRVTVPFKGLSPPDTRSHAGSRPGLAATHFAESAPRDGARRAQTPAVLWRERGGSVLGRGGQSCGCQHPHCQPPVPARRVVTRGSRREPSTAQPLQPGEQTQRHPEPCPAPPRGTLTPDRCAAPKLLRQQQLRALRARASRRGSSRPARLGTAAGGGGSPCPASPQQPGKAKRARGGLSRSPAEQSPGAFPSSHGLLGA